MKVILILSCIVVLGTIILKSYMEGMVCYTIVPSYKSFGVGYIIVMWLEHKIGGNLVGE